MRKSKSLARVRAGQFVRLCVLGHYIPAYVCHASRAGYDCIWLDLEHRSLPEREVQSLLTLSHLYDIDVMLRPPTLEKTRLYRYLEDGAAGLMIPHVSTPEKAAQLVGAVKFPPLGDRGLDNAGLDADFLLHDAAEYAAWANRETFLCVQIETPQAVEQAEAIAAVEGVDMLFVGPGDLGLRLQHETGLTLEEAWQRVAAACQAHGKAYGGPTLTAEEMRKRRTQGAQLLVGSSEFRGWSSELQQSVQLFEALDED